MSVLPSQSESVVTSRGLDLTGKIVPVLMTAFSLFAMIVGGYSAYAARNASMDTLIQERTVRAVETRAAVEEMKSKVPVLETKQATNERDIAELKKSIDDIRTDVKTLLERIPAK